MNKTEQTAQTKRTVQNHLRAFQRGDVPAIMADYAEGAVFYTPDGALRGKEAIRPLFEDLLARFPAGSQLEVQQQIIDERLAYLVWTGESEQLSIPLATDTILVHDGMIVQQTFAAQLKPKNS